jgi:hypothetical protein
LIGDCAEIAVAVGDCSEEDSMKTCTELSDLMLLSFIDAGEGVGFEDTLLVSSVADISLIVASDCLLVIPATCFVTVTSGNSCEEAEVCS